MSSREQVEFFYALEGGGGIFFLHVLDMYFVFWAADQICPPPSTSIKQALPKY